MDRKIMVSAVVLTLLIMSIPAAAFTADMSCAAASGDGDKYNVSMVEGEAYSYKPTYSISGVTTKVSGTAAAWLKVSDGRIAGTAPQVSQPGGKQTYDLTITATSEHPHQEAKQYISFTVYDKMTVTVDKPAVNTYVHGSVSDNADSNYTSGVTYSMTGAPSGVTINSSTGVISGTVNDTAKKYTATVTAKHLASGQTKSVNVTFNVSAALAVSSDADMYAVNGKLLPTDGGDPNFYKLASNIGGVTYKLNGGQMPTGMTLNADGTITGTPAAMGDSTVHITATETATGQTASFDLNIHLVSKLSFSSVPTGGIIVSGA